MPFFKISAFAIEKSILVDHYLSKSAKNLMSNPVTSSLLVVVVYTVIPEIVLTQIKYTKHKN